MSLRARLALGFAVLAAAAATTAAGIAYVATAARLHTQVDESLQQGAAFLASTPGRMGMSGARGLGTGPLMAGGGPLGALGLVVVQYLDAGGKVVSTQGEVALPVEPRDVSLASTGGTAWLHTVTADSLTYRVLTEPLQGGGAVQLARDDSETQATLASLRWQYALLDVGVAALAAAAGWVFARRLTGPLRRLASAAEHVASTGRLDVSVDSRGNDETGRLARAFGAMLTALSRSRDQQQHLAEDAGHELRTPLTSLRSNVDILRRHESLPPETRARVLGALDTELRELTGLVDELVELSTDHVDARAVEPVALDQLAEAVAERARQRSGRIITIDAEPCVVVGQSRALARAVSNLIDNAIKFSSPPAPIEVTVRGGRVEVRDHGQGLASEDLPRIFDRFYRSAGARSQAGSGLGLAIVSHVAETHGGRPFAANHPGGGAVIGFEVPALQAGARAPAPPPVADGDAQAPAAAGKTAPPERWR